MVKSAMVKEYHVHILKYRGSITETESLGTKKKFWLSFEKHPTLHTLKRQLFKFKKEGTGEDWAEKIVCEICSLLGLPHAQYELARIDDDDGCFDGTLSKDFGLSGYEQRLGNQLLWECDPHYPKDTSKAHVREHTIGNIRTALEEVGVVSSWLAELPKGIVTAQDVFVGYLMLDAWVANQDRHHENWAALQNSRTGKSILAPTFDHGASLAHTLNDDVRRRRLETKDRGHISNFVEKAKSEIFATETSSKRLSTIETFDAFAEKLPDAAKIWLEKLSSISMKDVHPIIDKIPKKIMSETSKEFTAELLTLNQRRLLKLQEKYNG